MDPINPDHYKGGGAQAIDVIEMFRLDFNLGNVVKYVLRAGKKGEKKEDLKKAIWYLQREIDSLNKGFDPNDLPKNTDEIGKLVEEHNKKIGGGPYPCKKEDRFGPGKLNKNA